MLNSLHRFSRYIGFATVSALVLCSVSFVHAASEGISEVEFSYIAWEIEFGETLFYRDGETYIPLELRRGKRSEDYRMSLVDKIELYESTNSGASYFNKIGECLLPKVSGKVLIVLDLQQGEETLSYRVSAVADPMEHFPQRGVSFINLSDGPLNLNVGETELSLVEGRVAGMANVIPDAGGFLPLIIKNTSGDVVFESRLFGQPSKCKMVFIYPPKSLGGKYSVKFLTEVRDD